MLPLFLCILIHCLSSPFTLFVSYMSSRKITKPTVKTTPTKGTSKTATPRRAPTSSRSSGRKSKKLHYGCSTVNCKQKKCPTCTFWIYHSICTCMSHKVTTSPGVTRASAVNNIIPTPSDKKNSKHTTQNQRRRSRDMGTYLIILWYT